MAATTAASPWGKPGAWALEAEEHEEELQKQQEQQQNSKPNSAAEFPSLAAAAKQPKKKKNQTLSLAEFTSYTAAKPTYEPKGLTHEDLLNLPTGPRQRSAEELDRSRGFRSYGLDSRNGDDSSNSRWGSGGGGNSRGFSREAGRESAPSRADEIDDWSKTKKSPVANGYEGRERGSFFESHSKADESDSWVSNKPAETRRFSSSNGGFERRGSFDSLSRDRHVYNNSGGGGAADSDNWARKKEESNGTGTTAARPRLVLQPRTLPVTDSNGNAAKPKGSSPFGDARPREEVLAEKGKDWKELDETLGSAKVNNSGRESEKGGRGDTAASGWRSPGNRRGESSWRKSDDVDSGSRPQSAEKKENGHTVDNQAASKNASTEGN